MSFVANPPSEKHPLRRVHSMDGLRGLFAIAVMVYHYFLWGDLLSPGPWQSFLYKMSIYAVCGFFIISGFSMSYVYGSKDFKNRRACTKFFFNRFLRIAPIYWLACLPKIFFHIYQGTLNESHLYATALNFTFLFGFFDPGKTSMTVGGWSIGIEWVLYFLFPVMIIIVNQSFLRLLVLATVSIASWQFILWVKLNPNQTLGEQWVTYAQPLYHAMYFVVGMVLAEAYRKLPEIFSLKVAIGGLLTTFGVLLVLDRNIVDHIEIIYGFAGIFYSLLVIIIVGLTSYLNFSHPSFLKICEFLGGISYPLYLTHFFIYKGLFYFLKSGFLTIHIGMVAAISIAHFIHQYFEKPILKFKSR